MSHVDHDLSPAPEPPDRRPRILVLRPDHLGDLLLTLPALRLLRRSFAESHITCLVAADVLPITERAVDIDRSLPLPFTLDDPPPDPRSLEIRLAARSLRGRFDLAILPRPNDPWSGALAAAAKIPVRIGHRQAGTLRFLTHSYAEDPKRHVAAEAEALVRHGATLLGGSPSAHHGLEGPLLELIPEDHAGAESVLSRLGIGEDRAIIVHPAAGWQLKTWPVDRWAATVSELRDRLGFPILLAGRPADGETLATIRGASRDVHLVIGVPIGVLAALHLRARLVVGMDSGALHLAALLGTPVVGLFGPFAPQRFGPVGGTRTAAIWRGIACSPCGTLEAPPCGASAAPACLRAVTPEEVVAAAVEVDRGNERPARFSVPPRESRAGL